MIEPKYVTFNQAKILKEKKFIENSNFQTGFTDKGKVVEKELWDLTCNAIQSIPRPEQHQVVDWLLEKHNIWISVGISGTDGIIEFYAIVIRISKIKIYKKQPKKLCTEFVFEVFDKKSPQEAYSAAFDYVLNNII